MKQEQNAINTLGLGHEFTAYEPETFVYIGLPYNHSAEVITGKTSRFSMHLDELKPHGVRGRGLSRRPCSRRTTVGRIQKKADMRACDETISSS